MELKQPDSIYVHHALIAIGDTQKGLVLQYQLHNRVETLPTFQPDALVFFRAKQSSIKVYYHPHACMGSDISGTKPTKPFYALSLAIHAN